MYRKIGKLSFQKDHFYMVVFQDGEDGPSEFIALLESEREAMALCEVLADRDDNENECYIVLPISAYESHLDYLDDEEIEL
jgi:hypothetical protein